MAEIKKSQFSPKPISLKNFYEKRNRVLIWNEKGGMGDVFMQRMMFEDFKNIIPDAELLFACLPEYLVAAKDHPCISEVLDSRTINPHDYLACYNTCVTIADRYENKKAPLCLDHRADIWAKYCGVTLLNHNMHFQLNSKVIEDARKRLEKLRKPGTPLVAFVPISKMINKTLLSSQIETIVNFAKQYSLVGIHKEKIPDLERLGIPGLYNFPLEEWMAHIYLADYVISVDTAAFHLAGGLKKPLMGIFTFADSDAYAKYFECIIVQKHRKHGNWDCGPCFKFGDCPKSRTQPKPCLTEITSEMLKDGIDRLFQRWPWQK